MNLYPMSADGEMPKGSWLLQRFVVLVLMTMMDGSRVVASACRTTYLVQLGLVYPSPDSIVDTGGSILLLLLSILFRWRFIPFSCRVECLVLDGGFLAGGICFTGLS